MDKIICPVCSHTLADGETCTQCGYRYSCDYEQYPTLGKIPAHSISRMHRCRQLLQSQLQAEYDKKTQQLRKELEQEKARCASLESKLQTLSEQNRTLLAAAQKQELQISALKGTISQAQRKEQSQAAEIEKLQKDSSRHPANPTEKGKTYGVSSSSSGHNTQKNTTTNLFGTGEAYYWGRECAVNYNKAFEYYTKAAAQGSTEALNRLGDCYAYGRGTEKSYAKAYDFYCRAAYKGLAEAQFNLGNCFYYGRGISKNLNSAGRWYKAAAAQNYQSAIKALNQIRNNLPKDISRNYGSRSQSTGGNTQKSAASSQTGNRSTQKNIAANLFNAGEAYYWGRGCAVDYNKAMEYYTKAAAKGSAEAINRLGNCCAYGRGTAKNAVKAFDYYCSAALDGLAEAQFNLGNCYYYGNGTAKNLNSAERWYKAAAAQNYQPAVLALNPMRNNVSQDSSMQSQSDRFRERLRKIIGKP